jgi:hypothetical protein
MKCPYLNINCDSDAPCCKKCTLYLQIKEKEND